MSLFNLRRQVQLCVSIIKLKQIHGVLLRQGRSDDQPISCILIDKYAKLGKAKYAQSIFLHLQNPDIVSWTSLISLYLLIGRPSLAVTAFSNLILAGHRPDFFSVLRAISACWRGRNVRAAKIVHAISFRVHLSTERAIGSALVDMYSRMGQIETARGVFSTIETRDVITWTSLLNGFILCQDYDSADKVFDEMPERNIVSWTTMISGCVRRGSPVRALGLFQLMKAEGHHHPTDVNIVAVLSGCADIGALDLGMSLHGYSKKCNLCNVLAVGNTLIDMYSKSGSLEAALDVFWEMPTRDVFSWTTMISGFAFHGKGAEAIEVFSRMIASGPSPNDVTFLSILSACSHGGMISEGEELFNKMINQYCFKPRLEHYGCMVDILGRAGRLEEAKVFVERMPVRPDAVIWRSILSSSVVHGNVMMAEFAGEKVIELEPDNDSVYVLLWNLYYSANMPEDALNVKKKMSNQSVKKKPGCSWIELNGAVHEFLVEDVALHVCAEICSVLDAIKEQSKMDVIHYFRGGII